MKYFILLLFTIISVNGKAAQIGVPSDFTTIQEAIDAAQDNDVIIVEPGTYIENINFKGKEIILASNFILTQNKADIITTIIDGSQPIDADTASVVRFMNGETNNSVLMGFTITGGSGTKIFNSQDQSYFRTGGGILIDYASPTVIHNIIENNSCTAETGVLGAGGGGIRMGFGIPVIEHNVIRQNIGGYAGGLMIAYCNGAILKNNLIVENEATGSFNGGGGVYVDWEPVTLENNTIANNHSGDSGGGIISTGTVTKVKNCLLYGNTATNTSPQIFKRFGGNAEVTYSCVEDGFDGTGDETGLITDDPIFVSATEYYVATNSPCVDAGDPDQLYNDIEDPNSIGYALFPSYGTLRNDIGVYGGMMDTEILYTSIQNHTMLDPFTVSTIHLSEKLLIKSEKSQTLKMSMYSFSGQLIKADQYIEISPGTNTIPIIFDQHSIVQFQNQSGYQKSSILLKLE